MIKKIYVKILKNLDLLSALSIRLVKITGKSPYPIHPKHLIDKKIWYERLLRTDDEILDLGAGSCQNDLRIYKKVKKIVCLDIDKKNLNFAKKEAIKRNISNVDFINSDANKKLPFKNGSFSKIICSDVLEHLYKRNAALSEIKRTLKKGGFLFLVTDNPDTSWKRLQKSQGFFYYADPDHKYEYPKNEILEVLKSKNFKILSCNPSTYDTPLKGLIDFTGGISLSAYKKFRIWRENMAIKYPQDTTGFQIIARKL